MARWTRRGGEVDAGVDGAVGRRGRVAAADQARGIDGAIGQPVGVPELPRT
jgi:hypothetical protein